LNGKGPSCRATDKLKKFTSPQWSPRHHRLHCSELHRRTGRPYFGNRGRSALGQKLPRPALLLASALHSKADMPPRRLSVR
jgi:hypothetical protein